MDSATLNDAFPVMAAACFLLALALGVVLLSATMLLDVLDRVRGRRHECERDG